MQYDAFTAIELAHQFFLRGVERIDAHAMIESFGYHKYPKRRARAARAEFIRRAMAAYDKHIEIDAKSFGRQKGKP
jgi:hypothetical protein